MPHDLADVGRWWTPVYSHPRGFVRESRLPDEVMESCCRHQPAGSEPTGDTSASRPPMGVMLNTAGLCLGDARSPFYETQQKPTERGQ